MEAPLVSNVSVANMVGGAVAVVACIKCENPGALPAIPYLGRGTMATETGDLGIIDG